MTARYATLGAGLSIATGRPFAKRFPRTRTRRQTTSVFDGCEKAMLAVAADDSDGDGYPNGAEIDVRTFPGDRNDAPTAIGDGQ